MKKKAIERIFILLVVLVALELISQLSFLDLVYKISENNQLKGELATLNSVGEWSMYNWEIGAYCYGIILANGSRITTYCDEPVAETEAYCGDGTCNGAETSSTCPGDCKTLSITSVEKNILIENESEYLQVVDETFFTSLNTFYFDFSLLLSRKPNVELKFKTGCGEKDIIESCKIEDYSHVFICTLKPGYKFISKRDYEAYRDSGGNVNTKYNFGYLKIYGAIAQNTSKKFIGNAMASDVDYDLYDKFEGYGFGGGIVNGDFWYKESAYSANYIRKNGISSGDARTNPTFTVRLPIDADDCSTCKVAKGTYIPTNKIQWEEDKTPENITITFSGIQRCAYFISPANPQAGLVYYKLATSSPQIPSGSFRLENKYPGSCEWTDTNPNDNWNVYWSPGNELRLTDKYGNTWFSTGGSSLDCNKYVAQNVYQSWAYSYPPPCAGGYKGTATINKCISSSYYYY